MKISHDKAHLFVREVYYPEASSRKCIHLLSFLCWFLMVFLGTTLIGVGASNNAVSYPFCSDSEAFCSENVLFNNSNSYYFYVRLQGLQQNNRLFMDSLSVNQMHGEVDNTKHCPNYYTYGSINLSQTVGGYRVNSSAHLHPCGQVMKTYAVDTIYLIDSQGGTPQLDNGNLISAFNKDNHFGRLPQYQMAQWVDVLSYQFINYFTVAATSTKYQLIGSTAITAGNYQLVMQNNFPTQGQFTKSLVISEVGLLGITNHLVGFTLFACGLVLLFLHIYVCFSWRK